MVMFLGTDSGILGVGAPEIVSTSHAGHSILFILSIGIFCKVACMAENLHNSRASFIHIFQHIHDMFISKTYRR